MSKLKYCILHSHSSFSAYDGFGSPKQRAERAKNLSMSHLCLTDHGTMNGSEEHFFYCNQVGVKPIIGLEAYYMNKFESGKDNVKFRRHMTLLAKNQLGYTNLCRLTSLANMHNYYYKPIIDLPLFEQYHEGIIALSGCVLGEIPQQIINDDFDEAKRATERFLELFGDNFYFEVQPQVFDAQKKANEGVIKLSQIYGRPCVMTNDSHYVAPEDLDTYMLFRRMGKNEVDELQLEQKMEQIREQYKELYISDGDEMNRRWTEFMGFDGSLYVERSQEIADSCEEVTIVFEEKVPEVVEYDAKGDKLAPERALANRAKQGLIRRGLWKEPYISRAKEEISDIVYGKINMSNYFLLTSNIMQYAKDHNLAAGPGRGSGVNSLIAYAVGITDVDPVKFDLMPQRFLTKERETLVDFDMDFGSAAVHHQIINYMQQSMNGQVAAITNFLRYEKDNLINDLGKALSMTADEIKLMKLKVNAILQKDEEPQLSRLLYDRTLRLLESKYGVVTHYVKMYGNPKAYGGHASGVAVTPGPIIDTVPLFVRGEEGERKLYTGYEMAGLIRANVVKFDILRVSTIQIVYDICRDLGIHPLDIPLDDPEVYDNYCKCNLSGIFQFDSRIGHQIIQQVQPRTIFDLMACTSLGRPGSLNLDQVDVYVEGKNGNVDTTTLHYEYCKDTFGALVYQEQIMLICRGVADMTWGEASKVMKNLKGLGDNHPLTIKFVEGAKKKKGLTDLQAKQYLQFFKDVTGYTFNKGHASAYMVVSYWTMWLKTKHPEKFFLRLLQSSMGKPNIKNIEADAVVNKLPIFLPHVNGKSNYHLFEPFPGERKAIRSGILSIKNVGGVAALAIEDENTRNGPFTSLDDFNERMAKRSGRKAINSRVLEALMNSGALEFDFDLYKKRTIEYNSRLRSTIITKRNGSFA